MGRRPIRTRREWLAVCGGTTAGLTALAGCTSSDDDDNDDTDSTSSNGEEGNGDEPTENGTEEEGNASSVGGSWPMSKFSANNGMVTDEWSGPDGPLEEGWTIETREDEKVSGPVVANGLVYVAIEGSKLYAIDVQSGDIEWEIDAEEPEGSLNVEYLPTTPAATEDAVYLLTDTLYALDPDTGDELWSVDLDSREPGDIRVYDGIVYIHNDGKLYAIDIEEQEVIWEDQFSSVQDIAIGDDGSLYVSHRTNSEHDYEVVGFNVEEAEEVWSYSPSGNVDSGRGLMVRDGTVYTHELDTVLAIDGETGEAETIVVYNDDDESVIAGRSPTIANGIIYSAGVFDQQVVFSREIESGEQPSQWNSDGLPSGPTGRRLFVSSDTLYLWRGYGQVDLNAINPETGEQQWSFDVREHQDMIRGITQGYAILEDRIIYTVDGNYSVIGALESA